MSSPVNLLQGPKDAPLLVLAHGAGAGMEHEFFQQLVPLLTDEIAVLRFNFPYMQRMLAEQKRRPPDRLDTLIESFNQAIPTTWQGPIFIGGKSMGGRVATHVALTNTRLSGVIVLGFPFHPPGKPERNKGEHLAQLSTPLLIAQGERDPFGNCSEITPQMLPKQAQLFWVHDGEHSFKPRKKSGLSWQDNLQSVALQIKGFIQCHIHSLGD